MSTFIHSLIITHTRTCMHAYTHSLGVTHTCTHTHTHTHTSPVLLSSNHSHVKKATDWEGGGERVIQTMKWGLIPSWHRGDPGGFPTLLNNCRSEGMFQKASFRNAVQKGQRCVVLADG